MFRVGFIGLGAISHENVRGYLNNPDAAIVAVSSLEESGARQWLARYRLEEAEYFSDYRRMLDNADLDIVEILTPHHLHCEQAVAAARAGVKGISLQKPMAPTLQECDRIITACDRAGARLKICENFVFYRVYEKAMELIREGLIGDLTSIRVHTITGIRSGAPWPWCFHPDSWRADPDKCGMGPLVGDDGFHKFSLARWFMQREFKTIGAWIDAETPLDAPAYVRIKFKRQPGDCPKYGQIDFSFLPEMALPCDFWMDDFVQIVGQKGIMWINQCSAAGDREIFRPSAMSESPVFPPIAVFLDGKVTTYLQELSPAERNWSHSFDAATRHFIEVMKGQGDPIYTGAEGKEINRYIIGAYVSAQEQRDIELDEITTESECSGNIRIENTFCNL